MADVHIALVKDLEDKKIVQIASGQQHSIAMDSDGGVYGWGFNGYCRLGLGNQVDALKPKVVAQFSGSNGAVYVAAGPTNSVVVDKQHMYFMAGKVCRLPSAPNPSLLTFMSVEKQRGGLFRFAMVHVPLYARHHGLQSDARELRRRDPLGARR